MILRYRTLSADLLLVLSIPCFVDCLNNPLRSSNVIAARGVERHWSMLSTFWGNATALLGLYGCKGGASTHSKLATCRLSAVAARRSRSTVPSISWHVSYCLRRDLTVDLWGWSRLLLELLASAFMDILNVFWITTASVFGLGVPGRFFCELGWNYAMIFYNIVVHKSTWGTNQQQRQP